MENLKDGATLPYKPRKNQLSLPAKGLVKRVFIILDLLLWKLFHRKKR
jgi:hypothetical protein